MTSAPPNIVRVVSGLWIDDNDALALVGRRRTGVYAGCWETPGGKVEPGETDAEALVRELREELLVVVTVLDPHPLVVVQLRNTAVPFPFEIALYRVCGTGGVPMLTEAHDRLRWRPFHQETFHGEKVTPSLPHFILAYDRWREARHGA